MRPTCMRWPDSANGQGRRARIRRYASAKAVPSGREVATYLRERPMSEYAEDLAPRMVRLREGIAAAEMALAEQAHDRGDRSLAQARAEYVLQHYPRTQAAADAAHLLMTIAAE
jgi:outer membrane protein assembly factor BamD (BamD/ComL family)